MYREGSYLGSLEVPEFKFTVTWQSEEVPLPPEDTTRVVTGGVHLRVPFMPHGSFGHLLRDNYEPIVRFLNDGADGLPATCVNLS